MQKVAVDLCTVLDHGVDGRQVVVFIICACAVKVDLQVNSQRLLALKEPENISIAEIIRLMDGALAPTLGVSKYFFEATPLEKEAKIIKVFQEIRDYISNKIEKLKISDLI